MRGHFDVQLKTAGGLDDAAFIEAIRRGEIGKVLAKLPTEVRARASNQLFDNFAVHQLDHSFSGPDAPYPYYHDSGGNASLSHITLTNHDDDTDTYTEDWGAYQGFHAVDGSVNTANASKRFVEDGITDHVQESDPDGNGKEAIRYTERWLYLPSQVISNLIKSIAIHFARDGDNTGTVERGRLGRVRLKDSQGRKIAISKTSKHVLLVEYQVTLISV